MDPNKGKYKSIYSDEFHAAEMALDDEHGIMAWGVNDYEAFTFNAASGVQLIFYPHRTSAHNYHIRVRHGSGDRKEAQRLMRILDDAVIGCTFSGKHRGLA